MYVCVINNNNNVFVYLHLVRRFITIIFDDRSTLNGLKMEQQMREDERLVGESAAIAVTPVHLRLYYVIVIFYYYHDIIFYFFRQRCYNNNIIYAHALVTISHVYITYRRPEKRRGNNIVHSIRIIIIVEYTTLLSAVLQYTSAVCGVISCTNTTLKRSSRTLYHVKYRFYYLFIFIYNITRTEHIIKQ